MDDTQASVRSTSEAGATRKRRSSILKSHRPPRTPLSELEFNVATPTDTTKSRRVSFSRRTGVAEFVTNEATTTWKNVYEEQNKSLENSGNDSIVNAPRQMSIGHIGKRIFDQQFEEVEIVDIGGTLQPKSLAQDFHTSLNNLNITQQLASLECPIDDRKLTAPFQNFELSSLTDHQSKVFRDDFTMPTMPEMTNPIDINFSIHPMSSNNDCDDLDEIVKDLGRPQHANVVCPGLFNGGNMSEYIEVDFNMTHCVKKDESEMYITSTILNPEVQEVSRSISSIHNKRKLNDLNNWIEDKENIAINPYVIPKESKNFAINDSDKILAFDGKKLPVKSEREALPGLDRTHNFRSNLLPDLPTGATPKRKTIVLNTNDDLPNFMLDNSAIMGIQVESSYNIPPVQKSFMYSESDLSINQAVNNNVEANKRKTIVFEDGMGNISVTQAVPAKVIINKQEKRKTIIYEHDNANISVTQAVPTNIIGPNKKIVEERKTVVYENDISFTQALPANLILNNISNVSQDKMMYYQDVVDMSVTQVIPDNIINIMKNKSNTSNISITQAIPSNIITADVKPNDSLKTLIFDTNEDINIELTQAVSDSVLLSAKNNSEKRKSMAFEEDGDISVTQAVPANIIFEKTKAIVFEEDSDISVTQAVPANIVFEKFEIKCDTEPEILKNEENKKSDKIKGDLCLEDQNEKTSNRRKTIIYNDEAGDISMTQVIPSNILMMKKEAEKMETSTDHDMVDISMTRALPTNILLRKSENVITEESSNLLWPDIDNNAQNILTWNNSENNDNLMKFQDKFIDENKSKQQSELHERSGCNLSMNKPIPSDIIDIQKDILKETEVCAEKSLFMPITEDLLKDNLSIKQDIRLYQAVEQSFSQTEVQSTTKGLNESLVNKENLTINHSFVTASETTLDNKNKESYIKEKLSMENECVSKKNSAMSQIISKSRDENLKAKKSFLNELLDMSNASVESVARNNVNATESTIVVNESTNDMRLKSEGKSNESLFIIMRDSDDDEKKVDHVSERLGISLTNDPNQRDSKDQPAIEYIEESDDVQDSHNKTAELKAVDQPKRTSNRHYERVISSDLYEDTESLNKSDIKEKSMTKSKKSFRQADDTRELLGMLSDFTEGENDELENEKPTSTVEKKENLAIENRFEPKRSSFMPRRQSIVLSRENLLHNISLAQAALQQSRFEVDEDESIEDTHDSPEEIEEEKSRRKSVRISNEVVKTLHFEGDDSITEASLKTSLKTSLLKKTAFGDTSYMTENKAKVIPSYLKDVSDNLKSLMSDLVKPMADVIPCETVGLDKSLKSAVSTCSTQIQANLVTSSQIDFDVELHSNCESVENIKSIKTNRSPNKVFVEKPASHKTDRTLTRSVPSVSISASMEINHSPPNSPVLQTRIKHPIPQSSVKGPIIVFDHHNPLNNVLLAPVDGEVHKYNPIKSTETMHSEHENFTQIDEKVNGTHVEVERLSTHYHVDSIVCQQSALQAGDSCVEILKDTNSLISNLSKPISIDRSTEGLLTEVKNTEVNTLIAMKENKELLEASSSLTLVDDALARSVFDVKIESDTTENGVKSPLRVVYQMETDGELLQKIDSDVASSKSNVDNDNDSSHTRKRSYSPTKRNQDNKTNIEITPKPVNKIQKMSNSHKKIERLDELIMCLDKMESVTDIDVNSSIIKSDKKPIKKRSPKCEKVVVQRISAEYSRETSEKKPKEESIDSLKNVDEGGKSMVTESSFTSSKHVRETQDVDSVVSTNPSSYSSSKDCMNWETDLDAASSRNLSECSSSANVVDKINMLRFMGRECEWESSGSDVWMFRLLRSRIRLTARLSHRHHNAARSRVLADTPLEAVTVDPIRQEVKDPLAAVCIRFAVEAMRYECTREGGCARASDVTGLLKRCAHVARVALRWARCMRDARYRLAYTITADGEVTLKVANIRLRSVWEVCLRLELVVEDAQEGAWPRASHARACAVLADCAAPEQVDVEKLASHLPRDWRHAPATIWTVFRYLKNKTRDDHLLGL
ncbi:uncharacterized protein [Maniola hyperantus]|uniref:uncharacterized protein n=1 Tax=Aphantopus hyperantus TaxID=2795564 RepID=UPI00213287F1